MLADLIGQPQTPANESSCPGKGIPPQIAHPPTNWNAQYLDDAIAYLRATGHEISDEDLQRLSPLQYEHIKMLGNFPFWLPAQLAAGNLDESAGPRPRRVTPG